MEYRRIPQHVGHVAELIIALVLMFLSNVAGFAAPDGARFRRVCGRLEADQSLANTPWQPDVRRPNGKAKSPFHESACVS